MAPRADASGIVEGPLGPAICQPAQLCHAAHGAVASFLGVVRNHHLGLAVTHLVYDCYRPMAERLLVELAAEVRREFDPEAAVIVYHGVGEMRPGDVSVAIHVAAAHRGPAFAGCRHLIERIKEDLPVWKQEYYGDGTSAWLKGS